MSMSNPLSTQPMPMVEQALLATGSPASEAPRASLLGTLRVPDAPNTCVRVAHWLLLLSYVLVFVVVAIALWQIVSNQSENHVVAWAIGAMCECNPQCQLVLRHLCFCSNF